MINPYRTVLIYVFALFQEVSPFIQKCGDYSCINAYCCASMCCPVQPERDFETPPFFIALMVFVGVLGFAILVGICRVFYKVCTKAREHQPEPARNQPIPPPPTSPPGPTAPPVVHTGHPPPYSEVVGKPFFYPAPVGQPPCYDNIAMEDLSRELRHQDQHSRIIPERPSAPAANFLVP